MPIWLLPVELLAKIALKYGLVYLEKKYPGIAPIIDEIIKIIGSNPGPKTVEMLSSHISDFKRD